MRAVLLVFVLAVIIGCSSSINTKVIAVEKIDKDSIAAIEQQIQFTEIDTTSIFHYNKPFLLFSFYPVQFQDNSSFGFIPLTEAYSWSEHPDSLAIENDFLNKSTYENDNLHVLKSIFKIRFFQRSGITESDQVFIYSITKDALISYPVSALELVAFVNPYGAQGNLTQYDYMIGFKIKDSKLTGNYLQNLVYIGKESPFILGKLKAIEWEKIESAPLSLDFLNDFELSILKNYSATITYTFEYNDLSIQIQNLESANENIPSARQLIITSSTTKQLLFTKIYRDTEGADLAPLNGVEESYNELPAQYAGSLFKGKPDVIFGFLSMSFGCPGIDFMAMNAPSIYIRCDNRH